MGRIGYRVRVREKINFINIDNSPFISLNFSTAPASRGASSGNSRKACMILLFGFSLTEERGSGWAEPADWRGYDSMLREGPAIMGLEVVVL